MSAHSKKLSSVSQRIRLIYEKERAQRDKTKRFGLWLWRWALMLYHEYLRDDVKVRAESLAYLMIFSLLPLIAGAFFIFTIFAQFGFVQEALYNAVAQFLDTIPVEHRGFVSEYVVKFKDAYLASLSAKSGSIGVFALFILIWIGHQTFSNVDRMLNFVWGGDRERPFVEQIRNFLVIVVAAPLVIAGGLSVPLILDRIPATHFVLETAPILRVLMNAVALPLLLLGTFFALYRFVPVRKVKWKPAFAGAMFAVVGFQLANWGMHLYFRFGTNSAYGKAAIIPLIGFWIYIVWTIVILGAEVSYIMQNTKDILFASVMEPTLKEGGAMLSVLATMFDAHRDGENPLEFEELRAAAGIEMPRLYAILDFLRNEHIVVECVSPARSSEGAYALGKDPKTIRLRPLLEKLYKGATLLPANDFDRAWESSLDAWLGYFDEATLESALTNGKRTRK